MTATLGHRVHLVVLNGPNLNRLGRRDPDVYGSKTLRDVLDDVSSVVPAPFEVVHRQSNHEGDLLDFLHQYHETAVGIICNPAGITSTGAALRDAMVEVTVPLAIVHITNLHARPAPWSRRDLFMPIATTYIAGMGTAGYRTAALHIVERASGQSDVP